MEKQTKTIDLWKRGEGRRSEMYGKSNMETYITICKRESQNHRICSMTQETQTGALYQYRGAGWGVRWEGGLRERGYIYIYTYSDSCCGLIENNKIL